MLSLAGVVKNLGHGSRGMTVKAVEDVASVGNMSKRGEMVLSHVQKVPKTRFGTKKIVLSLNRSMHTSRAIASVGKESGQFTSGSKAVASKAKRKGKTSKLSPSDWESLPDDPSSLLSLMQRGKGWSNAVMQKFFGKSGEEIVKGFAENAKTGPKAPRIPWRDVRFNQALRDDYNYMTQLHSDRLAQRYLASEDAHSRIRLSSDFAQYAAVFEREILSQTASISTSANSIPEAVGNYYYYARYVTNSTEQEEADSTTKALDLPIYCRKFGTDGPEEILLDSRELLSVHPQISIASVKLNADQSKILVLVDTDASETYRVVVRNLSATSSSSSAQDSQNAEIHGISNAEWAPDGKSFYYTQSDDKRRPAEIYHHSIGSPRSNDKLIFSEKDDQFFVDIARTKDRKFMTINSNSKTTSELRILDPSSPSSAPKMVMSKQQGAEFFLDHSEKAGFVIVMAENGVSHGKSISSPSGADANYKIMRCNDEDIGHMSKWEVLVPSSEEIKIDDMDVFDGHLVVYERHNGEIKIRVLDLETKESKYVPLEGLGHIEPGSNLDPKSPAFRFTFSSPINPGVTYDYHFSSGKLEVIKKLTVGRAEGARTIFNPEDFTLRRVHVDSSNGVKVPMTLVHRKDIHPSADTPTLIQAYGAYGHNLETSFDVTLLPLIERGWCIAYAHVRGGGELGLKWHKEGRLMKKRHTFEDLQSCVQWLFNERITAPQWLVGKAASAGGLPFAVMANEHPDTFKALLLKNPFVDVTTTMSDPSLPLTVHEYDEWGNPSQVDAFNNIFSYDPYYNIKPQEYPHMLIHSSAADIRVPAWNHARYVAKLRANKTDHNNILLLLDSTFGHFGDASSSGVASSAAQEWSFLFSSLNIVPSRI